jgi:hypothetical protein
MLHSRSQPAGADGSNLPEAERAGHAVILGAIAAIAVGRVTAGTSAQPDSAVRTAHV